MSTGDFDDAINAEVLRFFPELVAELGGNAAALLRDAALDPERILDGDTRAPYRQVADLLERAAEALGAPDLGLRLAARQGSRLFGPLGRVMRTARTWGEALEYVSAHAYAHSLAAAIWLRRGEGDGLVFVGHDVLIEGMQAKAQLLEQILLVGHLAAQEVTGGYARARRVHFRHKPVSPLPIYRRHFRCEVRFGQDEDGVFFSERDLARPVVTRDADAYRLAADYIEAAFTGLRPPLHAQVRALVLQRLSGAACTNGDIAAELKLHPRTLHRRLEAEGASFQQVKDEVRRDLLLFYLQESELDLASISAKLGFAEQSVLTRRCNAWFARSPSQMRKLACTARPS